MRLPLLRRPGSRPTVPMIGPSLIPIVAT
jgi:hypothetical protein